MQKTRIRIADGPSHLRDYFSVAASLPSVYRRYIEIKKNLFRRPVPFEGIGLALRPLPENPDAHLNAVLDSGVGHVLLRVHPWADHHHDEEHLAQALVDNNIDLVVSLPQNRDLVRDLPRWRDAIERIGERFSTYSNTFIIGHAVNRSKWGVWTSSEYVDLYREASTALRRFPDARILGPGVIDFEFQSTLAYLRRKELDFDAVASLLYVDRRGAPENTQMGLDTVDKITLLRAICDVTRGPSTPSMITEVNWPLWEGPHSPAGRAVSVDEDTQADFLVRYYILGLTTGIVERIYWWRLVARGYGLAALEADGTLRMRPSFFALRTLVDQLGGTLSVGPKPSRQGTYVFEFVREGAPVVAAWSLTPGARADLPFAPTRGVDRNGNSIDVPGGTEVVLGPSPAFFAQE